MDTPTFTIRPGRDADAAGFIALIGACWGEIPPLCSTLTPRRRSSTRWRPTMRRRAARCGPRRRTTALSA